MRGDRTIGRDNTRAVFLCQLPAYECVQRKIKRLYLIPQTLEVGGEFFRRHVVAGAPQDADVLESNFPGALIGEGYESRVALPHGRRNRVPSCPNFFERFGIAAGGHQFLDRRNVQTLTVLAAVFALTVLGLYSPPHLPHLPPHPPTFPHLPP